MALPFMALILAAFARHNSLPFQRGGILQAPGESQYQGQQTPSLPLLRAEGLMPSQMHSDSMVREGDTYHLPLAALRHGLSDALAWNEVSAFRTKRDFHVLMLDALVFHTVSIS